MNCITVKESGWKSARSKGLKTSFLFFHHQLVFFNIAVIIPNGQISSVLPAWEIKGKENEDVILSLAEDTKIKGLFMFIEQQAVD